MKVAITGSNGFLGKHVLSALIEQHIDITRITRPQSSEAAIENTIESVVVDYSSDVPQTLQSIGNPDVLIHLGWGFLPQYRNPQHLLEELPRHARFLKQLTKTGLKKIVVAGTCFEYGLQNGALDESTITQPNTAYGLAKDSLRRQLEFFQQEHHFELTWARLFYMTGSGQPERSLIPQLETAIAAGEKTFPMSRGHQLRDYLPVSTVAEYLIDLAIRVPGAGVVNICSGEPISIRELVERHIHTLGASITPELGKYPLPDYEPLAFWGNANKLKALTQK